LISFYFSAREEHGWNQDVPYVLNTKIARFIITGRRQKMLIVHVHVHVKPEFVEAFKQATIENAENSVKEPGVARFDVIQQSDDPTRFVLVEVYRNMDAPGAHKETAHYRRWSNAVMRMMAEPRQSVKYANVFPAEASW
jgi:autoinducer 2-degrading protein